MDEEVYSPETILKGLKTRFIGQKIIYFPTLDSTMNAARKEAQWGAEAGTAVIADEQTNARGRLQRTWLSPKGGLAISIILRPNLDYLPYMVMIASLAASYSIKEVTGIKPQIKWPNDILVNERKIGGILIENDIRKNVLISSIIGIGINVNLRVSDYPEIASIATSLREQRGKEVSRLELTRHLLKEMDNLYQSLPQKETIFEQWKEQLITLGQKVEVSSGENLLKGTAESVSPDGSLMLRQKDGRLIKISAGDVSLR